MSEQYTSLMEQYNLVPDEVLTEALNGGWYKEARATARSMARKYGVTLSTAAGVLAALSPRVSWKANVRGADAVFRFEPDENIAGFNSNKDKARRIAAGERPLSVLGGPKVTAFYRAIMGDMDSVVIDVHMYRAMGYDPKKCTIVEYRAAEAAVRRAAAAVGLEPAVFQAIVWAQQRGGGE